VAGRAHLESTEQHILGGHLEHDSVEPVHEQEIIGGRFAFDVDRGVWLDAAGIGDDCGQRERRLLERGVAGGADTFYANIGLVGEMAPGIDDSEDSLAVRRPDGSWLLDGLLPIDEMKDRLDIRYVPQESLGNYHTVGGFVLASLGRIPRKAESFTWAEWEFEVVDVDRNRVDQVLATHVSKQGPSGKKAMNEDD